MSCYSPCRPCQPCGPTPLANSCNEPCVRQCQDSTVVIEPPAVLVTLPGPILSSFPQNTAVGSSTSAAVGSILSSQECPSTLGALASLAWAVASVARGTLLALPPVLMVLPQKHLILGLTFQRLEDVIGLATTKPTSNLDSAWTGVTVSCSTSAIPLPQMILHNPLRPSAHP
ncbi:hypothetical protein DUI87_22021 [Hirundo rustica rustica]|uniref:Keratin n=1 Tax=Hirundo rustica rustica TaxID=333673 RepID=A0A3M0JS45_HIRRU|nr:hypothetical protein DUI87_22021 [Hirundo rustica rustica]